MKIPPARIDSFINSIAQNKEIFGALIYGPESGLVNINFNKIANLIVSDQSDPFLVSNIDSKKLEEDGALLFDEFVSISMLGGRKLIKIGDANNKITGSLKPIFNNDKKATDFSKPVGDNFILIKAEQLEADSTLRKFAENNPYFAAIACYEEDESVIKNLVRQKFDSYGLRLENGVLEMISNQFGKNRLVILSELEKIKLYMGSETLLTFDIAQKLVSDIAEISVGEFVNSFFDLNLKKSNQFLEKLFNEKVNCVAIIRFLLGYLMKLYVVKINLKNGSNLEQEIRAQRIFFKQEALFRKHLNIWDMESIKNLLSKMQELEVKLKSGDGNQELLLASFNNFCFLKYRNKLNRARG